MRIAVMAAGAVGGYFGRPAGGGRARGRVHCPRCHLPSAPARGRRAAKGVAILRASPLISVRKPAT